MNDPIPPLSSDAFNEWLRHDVTKMLALTLVGVLVAHAIQTYIGNVIIKHGVKFLKIGE